MFVMRKHQIQNIIVKHLVSLKVFEETVSEKVETSDSELKKLQPQLEFSKLQMQERLEMEEKQRQEREQQGQFEREERERQERMEKKNGKKGLKKRNDKKDCKGKKRSMSLK